jgi:acyl carrier protein
MVDKLREIINLILVKQGKSELENIDLKDNLKSDIGLDSLDLAELTVRLEEEFGVDVFEDGIVETVEEILTKLSKK